MPRVPGGWKSYLGYDLEYWKSARTHLPYVFVFTAKTRTSTNTKRDWENTGGLQSQRGPLYPNIAAISFFVVTFITGLPSISLTRILGPLWTVTASQEVSIAKHTVR